MAESRVKDGNYITIQSFMVKDMKLKGNELLIYAIIYGFSQNGETRFNGSLQYIADWTNSTKQGVMKNLKGLVEKGFIEKTEIFKNGVKFVEYHVTDNTTIQQSLTGYETKFNGGMQQSLTGDIKQSLPNNISSINNNKIKDNIKYIVDFLNEKAEKKYRDTTPKTASLIKARFDEGFTVDDFKTVIDNMVSEWKGGEMDQYLRPETLFGTKFEGYLNRKPKSAAKPKEDKFCEEPDFDWSFMN